MRILVCGGRDFTDRHRMRLILNGLPPNAIIVHGAQRGADRMAGEIWTQLHGKDAVEPHPADWKQYGKAAGPIRNQEMIDSGIDLVIALPGGNGTSNMITKARRKGVPVKVIQ